MESNQHAKSTTSYPYSEEDEDKCREVSCACAWRLKCLKKPKAAADLNPMGQLCVPSLFARKQWFPKENANASVLLLWTRQKLHTRGVSADIFTVKYKGRAVCLKRFSRKLASSEGLCATECQILHDSKHSGIVKLLDVFLDEDYFYMLSELAYCDLHSLLPSGRRLCERKARRLVKRLLEAVRYLHEERRTAHRDLKPENVVFHLSEPSSPVVIDFGDALSLASLLSKHSPNACTGIGSVDLFDSESIEPMAAHRLYELQHGTYVSDVVGTLPYMAPERFRSHNFAELLKSDIWAIGVMAYEMLTGRSCFQGRSQKEIVRRIANGRWDDSRLLFKSCDVSSTARSFIKALLCLDPKKRLSSVQALAHPWIDKDFTCFRASMPMLSPEFASRLKVADLASGKVRNILAKMCSTQKGASDNPLTQVVLECCKTGKLALFSDSSVDDSGAVVGSSDVLRQLRAEFDVLDRDGDGYVSARDLAKDLMKESLRRSPRVSVKLSLGDAFTVAQSVVRQLSSALPYMVSFEDFIDSRTLFDLTHASAEVVDDMFAEISAMESVASDCVTRAKLKKWAVERGNVREDVVSALLRGVDRSEGVFLEGFKQVLVAPCVV